MKALIICTRFKSSLQRPLRGVFCRPLDDLEFFFSDHKRRCSSFFLLPPRSILVHLSVKSWDTDRAGRSRWRWAVVAGNDRGVHGAARARGTYNVGGWAGVSALVIRCWPEEALLAMEVDGWVGHRT